MLGKMLSEETLKGRWIHAVSSGPSLREGRLFSASQLKLKRDRSCLWCFSVMFIFSSVRHCFLLTGRSCLKNPTQVNAAVCINQYIHLHVCISPHTFLPTPVFLFLLLKSGIIERVIRKKCWSIISNGFDETHTYTQMLPVAFRVTQTCLGPTVVFLYCDVGHIFRTVETDKNSEVPSWLPFERKPLFSSWQYSQDNGLPVIYANVSFSHYWKWPLWLDWNSNINSWVAVTYWPKERENVHLARCKNSESDPSNSNRQCSPRILECLETSFTFHALLVFCKSGEPLFQGALGGFRVSSKSQKSWLKYYQDISDPPTYQDPFQIISEISPSATGWFRPDLETHMKIEVIMKQLRVIDYWQSHCS